MNAATFNALLTPYFESHLPQSREDAADAIATAYHLSNIGQTTTMFAAPLLNADKSILKTFIQLSLDINFYGSQIKATLSSIIASINATIQEMQAGSKTALKDGANFIKEQVSQLISSLPLPLMFLAPIINGLIDGIMSQLTGKIDSLSDEAYKMLKKLQGIVDSLDVSGISYTVMATGFSLYWLTANMSPMPPMPPCIAPTGGTTIIFPGSPIPLNNQLKNTFKDAQSTPQAIVKLYNALISHQLTVAGIYTGIIPLFPSPVPGPPIPWFGLLNIPLPEIKLPTTPSVPPTPAVTTPTVPTTPPVPSTPNVTTPTVPTTPSVPQTPTITTPTPPSSPKVPDVTSTFSNLTEEVFNG